MKFFIDRAKYIDSGLVREVHHPEFPLVLYNYTQECQFSKAWDDVTLMCRGLIVNKETNEIVARPFKKFFNYEEHIANGDVLPLEEPWVFEKLDGSLGIMYWWDHKPYIATRGSFTSDQALWATEWIRENDYFVNRGRQYTSLFEIIYPENRIVVSYGERREMVWLADVDNETGRDFMVQGKDRIKFTSYEQLKALNTPNEEGFVLFYPNENLRVKIKFDDYVALHKVMTGLSQIGIWEMLRDGKNILEIIKDVPDEMHGWIKEVCTKILLEFQNIERVATQVEMRVRDLPTRKEQAEIVMESKYPGITFSMLDGKDYQTGIWRLVRPKGQVTFRNDIDK